MTYENIKRALSLLVFMAKPRYLFLLDGDEVYDTVNAEASGIAVAAEALEEGEATGVRLWGGEQGPAWELRATGI